MANSMQNKISEILKEKYGITVDWKTYVCNGNNKSWSSTDMSHGIADGTNSKGNRCKILFYCMLKDILVSEIEVAGHDSISRIGCSLDTCNEIWIDTKIKSTHS